MLDAVGAVAATSANEPGDAAAGEPRRRPGRDPRRLRRRDRRRHAPGLPSTVIDFSGPAPAVLRVGAGDPDGGDRARLGEALSARASPDRPRDYDGSRPRAKGASNGDRAGDLRAPPDRGPRRGRSARSPTRSSASSTRQRGQIELIASENFTWPAVLEAVGSTPTNKYAEGYPGKRYYGGCEVVDEIEELARERAKSLFGAEHANVQPHAGAQANMAVYFAVLEPGDRVLGLSLDHGGHLTHGLKVNFSGKLYEFHHYGVSRETMMVDYDEVLAQGQGGAAEADRLRRLGLSAPRRGRPVPRDRRRGRGAADDRHGALRGPRRRRAPPEPGAALALRHLDDAQDPRRAAGRVRALPRGARAGARPGPLPGHAGRAADAHDRGEGGLLPDRGDARRSATTSGRCARTPTRSPPA